MGFLTPSIPAVKINLSWTNRTLFPSHLSPSSSLIFLYFYIELTNSSVVGTTWTQYSSCYVSLHKNFICWTEWDNRRCWMNHLLMQSMVKAQCLSNGKWAGISKCICVSLICAVREKQVLMKGICLPLDPAGRWGENAHWSLWRTGSGVKSSASSAENQSPLIL